jgi:hypothetical protein
MADSFDGPRGGYQFHERQNSLTPADEEFIKSVVESVYHVKMVNTLPSPHGCRFPGVAEEEFMEIVKSHRKFNVIMDDSKKTARKFFLVIFLVFITGAMTDGLWSRIISKLKSVVSP